MEVRVYVVGAGMWSKVPWEIQDTSLLFFGPCKKLLRQEFKNRFLKDRDDNTEIRTEDVWLLGINPARKKRRRTLHWAGKVVRVMTFAVAHRELRSSEYRKMRENDNSPLHIRPVMKGERLVGYQHRSALHGNNWPADLIDTRHHKPRYSDGGKTLLIPEGTNGFQRDCCMLCKGVFFGERNGVPIPDRIVNLLRQEQKGKVIDSYALFGRDTRGHAIGVRGGDLCVSSHARTLVSEIRKLINTRKGIHEDHLESKRVRC